MVDVEVDQVILAGWPGFDQIDSCNSMVGRDRDLPFTSRYQSFYFQIKYHWHALTLSFQLHE